jgi:hypothetical protein
MIVGDQGFGEERGDEKDWEDGVLMTRPEVLVYRQALAYKL